MDDEEKTRDTEDNWLCRQTGLLQTLGDTPEITVANLRLNKLLSGDGAWRLGTKACKQVLQLMLKEEETENWGRGNRKAQSVTAGCSG